MGQDSSNKWPLLSQFSVKYICRQFQKSKSVKSFVSSPTSKVILFWFCIVINFPKDYWLSLLYIWPSIISENLQRAKTIFLMLGPQKYFSRSKKTPKKSRIQKNWIITWVMNNPSCQLGRFFNWWHVFSFFKLEVHVF